MAWQSMETAPKGWHYFFLVRPKGIHQGYGSPFAPTVVQQLDNKFYPPENEFDFVNFGDRELEWHELPE